MNLDRKEMIVKEIKYWKESKLLPQKYCDFLLMLYTQGEGNSNVEVAKKKPINIWFYIDVIFLLLLLPVPAFLLLDETFQIWIKLAVLIITILIASIHIMIFNQYNKFIFHLSIIVTLTNALTASIYLSIIFNLSIHPAVLILINCLCWGVIGLWKRYSYLIISGAIGIAVLIANYYVI